MHALIQWCLAPFLLQVTEPTPRALIDSALARLGGADHVRAQRAWFVAGVGEENLSAELQGLAPDAPTTRAHEEWLGVDAARQAVAWERRTPRNDMSLRWRRFIYRDDSTGVIVWTDSVGRMNANAVPETRRRALIRRIPHLLLLEAARSDSLRLGRVRTIERRRQREVRVLLDGEWISLWIGGDAALYSAEYRTVLPGKSELAVEWQWPEWQTDSAAVTRPRGHRVVIDGQVYQRVDYRRFEAGSRAADSLLRVPNEVRGRMVMPSHHAETIQRSEPLPASGEVAPGIHVEQIAGFNVFIVEFANFVLLAETPAIHPGFESIPATRSPDRIGADAAARIRAIARGRPLGYTVLTHHHSDHIGSAAALAPLTNTFLVPADSDRLIGEAVAGTAARVERVAGRRIVRDSTRTVIIYDVGANPHTRNNLFVWLPNERIGFQGDLFYYDEGAPSIPPDRRPISEFFARWLRRNGIVPRAIYGVHSSGSAGPEILGAVLGER